jgi:chromatin remodeling complex protein RSC6
MRNLSKPVDPSPQLGEIVGAAPLPRSEVVSKVWDHIRKNNLQNPQNKREIIADDKLRKIFGKDRATMFEMNKHLQRHLKDADHEDGAKRAATNDRLARRR